MPILLQSKPTLFAVSTFALPAERVAAEDNIEVGCPPTAKGHGRDN